VAEAAGDRRHLVTSRIEHPATAKSCAWLEQHGWSVTLAGVDANGATRLDDVRVALSSDTALVTVMHANGETGVLQPVAEIAELAHAVGAMVHTDAAQSIGKVPLNVRRLGIDLLSLAGHKVYAPKGIGALYVRRGTPLLPVVVGAGHERGLRPGTENVAAIVGLGVALERVGADLQAAAERMRRLRDELWDDLRARIPGVVLNGDRDRLLPNTLNVRVPGVSARMLLHATPQIAASAGSACHAGEDVPSRVLTAMGVRPEDAIGSVRLSLGRFTTGDDIVRTVNALARAWTATRDVHSATATA
jgi:cysteine desulfurase